jgi:ribosomal protein S18 acetylase RimI-like enzyme
MAGFAILGIDTVSKTAQIHDIMIKKEFQGKGAGTEAMHKIEEYLKNKNIGMILLESGMRNKDAHDFFEKNGFTQISVEFAKRLNILHAKTEDEKMHDFFIQAMTKTFNKKAEYYKTHTILIGEENDPEYFTVDNVRLEKDKDIDNLMQNVGTQSRFSGIDIGMIWNKGKTYQDPYFDSASKRFPEDYRGIIMSASPQDIKLAKKQRIPVEIYLAGEKQLDDICYAYNAGMNAENSEYNTDINYNRVMKKIVTLTDPCFKTEVLLARSKENGKIAGLLIGVYNESMAYLNDVSVLPEFQNRGLASLFTQRFAEDMRAAGVKEIILDTRKDTDEQKKSFTKTNQKMYARLGFVDRIETFQTMIKEVVSCKL